MTSPVTIDNANLPWNGAWWVKPPADYVPGLYRLHQIEAHLLLKRRRGLTNWSAYVLQELRFRSSDPTSLQEHWLRKVEREVEAAT